MKHILFLIFVFLFTCIDKNLQAQNTITITIDSSKLPILSGTIFLPDTTTLYKNFYITDDENNIYDIQLDSECLNNKNSVAISQDISGSMHQWTDFFYLQSRNNASDTFATELIKLLDTTNEFYLEKFDDTIEFSQIWTHSKNIIIKYIDSNVIGDGNNDFNEQLLNIPNGLLNVAKTGTNYKKIAIIITDGVWQNFNLNSQVKSCIDTCKKYNISFYAIIVSDTLYDIANKNWYSPSIINSLQIICDSTNGKLYNNVTNDSFEYNAAWNLISEIKNKLCDWNIDLKPSCKEFRTLYLHYNDTTIPFVITQPFNYTKCKITNNDSIWIKNPVLMCNANIDSVEIYNPNCIVNVKINFNKNSDITCLNTTFNIANKETLNILFLYNPTKYYDSNIFQIIITPFQFPYFSDTIYDTIKGYSKTLPLFLNKPIINDTNTCPSFDTITIFNPNCININIDSVTLSNNNSFSILNYDSNFKIIIYFSNKIQNETDTIAIFYNDTVLKIYRNNYIKINNLYSDKQFINDTIFKCSILFDTVVVFNPNCIDINIDSITLSNNNYSKLFSNDSLYITFVSNDKTINQTDTIAIFYNDTVLKIYQNSYIKNYKQIKGIFSTLNDTANSWILQFYSLDSLFLQYYSATILVNNNCFIVDSIYKIKNNNIVSIKTFNSDSLFTINDSINSEIYFKQIIFKVFGHFDLCLDTTVTISIISFNDNSECENQLYSINSQTINYQFLCGDEILYDALQQKNIEFIVQPNPANQSIIIKSNKNIPIEIYSVNGILIRQTFTNVLIDCSDLKNGTYYIETKNKTNKFMILH